MALFNPSKKHRRTIIFYSLAIIIPGIFLSIMAYRGMQGNYLVIEKIQAQELSRIGKNFFVDLENSLSDKIDSLSKEESIQTDGFIDFRDHNKRIEFCLDKSALTLISGKPDDTINILQNSLLFVPERYWSGILQTKRTISIFSMALEEEFVDGTLVYALHNYEKLYNETDDLALRLQSLMSQARLYRKLNQIRQLKEVYRDIFELSKDPKILPLIDPVPRNLMADIITQWINTNEFSSDAKDNSIPAMEIVSFLAIPQIYLTQSNYLQCFEDCENLLAEIKSQASDNTSNIDMIDSLMAVRRGLIHENNIVIKLSDQIFKTISNKDISADQLKQRSFSYFEDSVSLYTTFAKGNNGQNLALVVNMHDFLLSRSHLLSEHRKMGDNLHWRITDERDRTIIADQAFDDKKIHYNETPIGLGVWALQIQNDSQYNSLRNVLLSQEALYLVGFIFIIIGLVIGLALTLRGLAQENRLTRLKSDFISSVSHDLKSPVTSIRQMSELLERDRIPNEERKKEYYSIMLAQSERLSHLVDNILDFARLEYSPKELRLESTQLDTLLRGVVETFSIRLRYTGFAINASFPDSLPPIMIDREGMQQVFYNLLDNAYKYSGKSKVIAVSMKKLSSEVEVVIQDFGIGIHPKDQKKIFDRYFRGKFHEIKSIKGTGIGLAIVHQVVKAHKGRLELVSKPGLGSSFKVYLPI